MSIQSEQTSKAAENKKAPFRFNRRTFLQLTAATGLALTAEALSPNAAAPVRAQSAEQDQNNEALKQQRTEFLNKIEEKIDIAVIVTLEYLRIDQQFQIPENGWRLSNDVSISTLNRVHNILRLYAQKPELAYRDFKNPEYIQVFFDEKMAVPEYTFDEPQQYIFDENANFIDLDQWQTITRSLIDILLPTQASRIRIVNMSNVNESFVIGGKINVDATKEINADTYKKFVHEICHMCAPTPKFCINDAINGEEFYVYLAGNSYSQMVDNYNEWIVLLREEFNFLNKRFFSQEGDLLKSFLMSDGGNMISRVVEEMQAMLQVDMLCEDIAVFESYPPRIQELLLKILGQSLYVQEVDRVFTKDDLLELRVQIAVASQGAIPIPESAPDEAVTENEGETPGTEDEIQPTPEPTPPPQEDTTAPPEEESNLGEGMKGAAGNKDGDTKDSITTKLKNKINAIFSKKK
jgi:hypothetical protein